MITLSKEEGSLNLIVIILIHLNTFSLDRGFAFSQEAGHAPQITDNLLKKFKQTITSSFKPRVVQTHTIQQDRKLTNIIMEEDEEEE